MADSRENVPASTTTPSYERKTSISEAIEINSTSAFHAPKWLSWVEIPFHVANPKTGIKLPEAAGWAMDACGRGPLNLVGSYVGAAILRMAIKEAGGPNNVVRGLLKPSSLLTAMASLIGVIGAFLMPVFGAIVDHTEHRRMVGVVSGFIAVLLIGIQTSISLEKNNWFFILVIDAIQSFALVVHQTAVTAYLPDLSTDEQVTSHYTAHFSIRLYVMQFFFISLVIISTLLRGNSKSSKVADSVTTARDAAGIAFTIGAVAIGYSWIFLFRDRPALSKVPEGSNLVTTGFVQVAATGRKILSKYRALSWFMFSLLWSPEAGAGVVLSIAVTYLTVVMKFNVGDIAKSTLILLSVSVPGSYFGKWVTKVLNPLNSYRIGMAFLGVGFGICTFLFTGPERKKSVFGVAAMWGFGLGWAYPSQKVLICTLIPKGQETEMMGLLTFMSQILGWLPPLIVTILNEKGYDMKWSLFVVFCFCMFAVICTFPMGNYQEACAIVERESEEKYLEVLKAAAARKLEVEKNEETGGIDLERSTDMPETALVSDENPATETVVSSVAGTSDKADADV